MIENVTEKHIVELGLSHWDKDDCCVECGIPKGVLSPYSLCNGDLFTCVASHEVADDPNW